MVEFRESGVSERTNGPEGTLLRDKLDETWRRLDEIGKSINNLLDLAEQFRAASAGARLVEREAEQAESEAELMHLENRQEAQHPTLEPETIQVMLGRNARDSMGHGHQSQAEAAAEGGGMGGVGKRAREGSIHLPSARCGPMYSTPGGVIY